MIETTAEEAKPRTLELQMQTADIRGGICKNVRHCAVARCINRHLADGYHCEVNDVIRIFETDSGEEVEVCHYDRATGRFIDDFDHSGATVEPIVVTIVDGIYWEFLREVARV